MTSATAHDYVWIRTSRLFRYALEVGYTLTLVRGVTPEDVLRVMGADPQGTCQGADALIERQGELREGMDYWDEAFLAGAFAVAGHVGEWPLILQFDGGVGMQGRFLEVLSIGGRAVMHSSNGGKPIHLFCWYEDGELRTTFEGPAVRDGSTPDDLVEVMPEVGFALSAAEEEAAGAGVDTKAAVFALAERLSGVRVSEALLQRADYQLGHVPEEPAEDWTGIVIDITDAHGDRFYREFSREDVEAAADEARAQANAPIVIEGPFFSGS
ncbi:DUF6461 domain-containing protein [Streptomyces avermitilis]|uniref:DUF6461 domain-containing protein n=1 Tax=Streptomyces avermitilis TaxID=33903 RepID=UPI0033F75A84